jgi:hypothetical protein
MKKLILALLAVGSISAANAQKNTVLLYGNGTFATNKVDYFGGNDVRTTAWGINPGIGYQFSNHMTMGLQGGFNQTRTPYSYETAVLQSATPFNVYATGINNFSTYINNSWSVGGFMRNTVYFGDIFFAYSQLDLSYIAGSNYVDGLSSITRTSYNGFAGAFYPAIGVFIHKGVALNFNVGGVAFSTTSSDDPFVSGESSFIATFGRTVNFGVSRNIGCHTHHARTHVRHESADMGRYSEAREENEEMEDDYSSKKARLKAKRERQKVRIKSQDEDEE